MNVRRGLVLAVVGVVAAAVTAGAGLRAVRGPVAEGRVVSAGEGERFEWVDVFVRGGGDAAVGAWQVELRGEGGVFVGVEGEVGGEPPMYDARALSGGERLVIGAVRAKTAKAEDSSSARSEQRAPSPPERGEGKAKDADSSKQESAAPGSAGWKPAPQGVRVARVHVRVSGRVEFVGVLAALGDVDGKRIGGTVELVRGEAGRP